MKEDATQIARALVELAQRALRDRGMQGTHAEVARILKTHPNQVGLAAREVGLVGFGLILRWVREWNQNSGGRSTFTFTMGPEGPSLRMAPPEDPGTALTFERQGRLPHEWVEADASYHGAMTCRHCFIARPQSIDGKHAVLSQECPVRLRERISSLESAIRRHRGAQGHSLCWQNDTDLWSALGDGSTVDRKVPPWPEFIARCAEYRAMLDTAPKEPQTP